MRHITCLAIALLALAGCHKSSSPEPSGTSTVDQPATAAQAPSPAPSQKPLAQCLADKDPRRQPYDACLQKTCPGAGGDALEACSKGCFQQTLASLTSYDDFRCCEKCASKFLPPEDPSIRECMSGCMFHRDSAGNLPVQPQLPKPKP